MVKKTDTTVPIRTGRRAVSTTLTGMPAVNADGVVDLVNKTEEPVQLVHKKEPAQQVRRIEPAPMMQKKGPARIHVHMLQPEDFRNMKEELEGQGYRYMGRHSKDTESYTRMLKSRAYRIQTLRENLSGLTDIQREDLQDANLLELKGPQDISNRVQEICWLYRQKGCDLVTITKDDKREKEYGAIHVFYRKRKN